MVDKKPLINVGECLNPNHITNCEGTYPDCMNLIEDDTRTTPNKPNDTELEIRKILQNLWNEAMAYAHAEAIDLNDPIHEKEDIAEATHQLNTLLAEAEKRGYERGQQSATPTSRRLTSSTKEDK